MLQVIRRLLVVTLTVYVAGILGLALIARVGPLAGFSVYAVRSASMAPAIRIGDLIVEERVDPAQIQAGDVITLVTASGAYVTHRVATVTPNEAGPYFTTKGDANRTPDAVATTSSQVRGRVAWHVPVLGLVLAMATMPTGVFALFLIGGSMLVAIWLLEELEDRDERDDLAELVRLLDPRHAGVT